MDQAQLELVRANIRDIPDFPKPGIIYKDITPLLRNPAAFDACLALLEARYKHEKIDLVVGVESRGFIFGAALARALGAGFVPARKPGKLPYKTVHVEYELEYGTDRIEMHVDAVEKGQRVLVVDDLMATGGTAAAAMRLVTELGGDVIEAAFVIELTFLKGADKVGVPCFSLLKY